jgi:hypothetical protein
MQHARLLLLQVVVFQHSFGYLGRVDVYEFDARLLPLVTVAGGVIVWWRSGRLWAVTFLLLYPALGLAVERVCDALFRWAVQDNLGWSLGVRNVVAAVWPVALILSAVLLPPLGIIERLRADHPTKSSD